MFIFQQQESSVLRSHSSPELKLEQPVLAATNPLVTDDIAEFQPGLESQKPVVIMRSMSVSGTDINKKHPSSDDKPSSSGGVEIRTTSSFEAVHPKREQRPRSGILSSVSEESDLATLSNRNAGNCIETPLSIFYLLWLINSFALLLNVCSHKDLWKLKPRHESEETGLRQSWYAFMRFRYIHRFSYLHSY